MPPKKIIKKVKIQRTKTQKKKPKKAAPKKASATAEPKLEDLVGEWDDA
jgi:hypothetical protein